MPNNITTKRTKTNFQMDSHSHPIWAKLANPIFEAYLKQKRWQTFVLPLLSFATAGSYFKVDGRSLSRVSGDIHIITRRVPSAETKIGTCFVGRVFAQSIFPASIQHCLPKKSEWTLGGSIHLNSCAYYFLIQGKPFHVDEDACTNPFRYNENEWPSSERILLEAVGRERGAREWKRWSMCPTEDVLSECSVRAESSFCH